MSTPPSDRASRFLSRRAFLGATAVSLALPSGLRANWPADARPRPAERTLVLVELAGANDGLNTVVPYADDAYHRMRPTLRRAPATVLELDDHMGLAPMCRRLHEQFAKGRLAIVQGVGFPTPERSHFEGFRRWHQGTANPRRSAPGWLAPRLESDGLADADIPALAFGTRSIPDMLAEGPPGIAAAQDLDELVPSPELREALASSELAELDELWGDPAHRERARAARRLLNALSTMVGRTRVDLPGGALGAQFADALRVLQSAVRVPVLVLRHEGYDTHARQGPTHDALLSELDAGLGSFLETLHRDGLDRSTLVVVHSEFGRRAAENGTRGTDHGAGAPVLFAGGRSEDHSLVRPGLHAPRPDFERLEHGDVAVDIDFRRILATAAHWLGDTDPASHLGEEARPLQF